MTRQQEIIEMLKQKKTYIRTPVAQPEPEHQAPTDLHKSLWAGPFIEYRPAAMQPKSEAKLLTVIGLTTMHAVCLITFMLYLIFIYRRVT